MFSRGIERDVAWNGLKGFLTSIFIHSYFPRFLDGEIVKLCIFYLVYFLDSEDENDAEEIHLGENTTAKRTRTLKKKKVHQLCAFCNIDILIFDGESFALFCFVSLKHLS